MNSDALKYYGSIIPTVAEFTKPLKAYLGISYFVYIKVYKNSKYMFISNDSHLSQDYISNIHCSNIFYRDYIDTKGSYYPILWPALPENESMEIFFNYGYWHGLSLISHYDDHFEAVCFLSDKDNHKINDFYIKNIRTLEKYADHFKSTFSDNIISRANQNLATYEKGFDFYLPIKKIENDSDKIRAFLQASGIKAGSVNINGNAVKITHKELKCLELMSKGLSMKGIARELLLSPRTIESHISNIKSKTGYNYKYDLMQLYQNELIKV